MKTLQLISFNLIILLFSCKAIFQVEKVELPDIYNPKLFSSENMSDYNPVIGDSIIFHTNSEKLKNFIRGNKVVWLHFVNSSLCADAKLYDCKVYKELNAKYRTQMKYVMVTELVHMQLAQQLKNGCDLVGYHTYVDDPTAKAHNEIQALRRLKDDVFNFSRKDTMRHKTNYIILDGKIVYATDQTLDVSKVESIFNKL